MGLTRKMLKAMGIEEEKIDQIVEAHTETVEALKQQCEEFKQKAADFDGVQKELDKLKAADQSGKEWKEKFEKLQADVESRDRQAAVTKAYKKLLQDSGVDERAIDIIVKGTDLSSFKLDKEGEIADAETVKGKIKADYGAFITQSNTVKDVPPTPPAQQKTKMSREDIMAIKDTSERQKAIAENSELFGF